MRLEALAYLRTSSSANVGADKDSEVRQRQAIGADAKRSGIEIIETFYDAAVSGADPVASRPGFAAMLERSQTMACARSSLRPLTVLHAI